MTQLQRAQTADGRTVRCRPRVQGHYVDGELCGGVQCDSHDLSAFAPWTTAVQVAVSHVEALQLAEQIKVIMADVAGGVCPVRPCGLPAGHRNVRHEDVNGRRWLA